MGAALGWGALAASSLVVGALLGRAPAVADALVGAVLAFGAGALISAVSFDLVEEGSKLGDPGTVGIGLAIGALTYFGLDRVGRAARVAVGRRRALALGAFLDGIPEQMVLGIGLATGEGVSVGLLVAIFVSNLPEAIGSATDMRGRGPEPGGRSAACGSPSRSSARSPRSAATRWPTPPPTTSGRSSTASRRARCW